MPKINQEEYEVLKELDDGWKWIARDEDGDLYAYDVKPERLRYMWFYECGDAIRLAKHEHLFQFIQWEDSEPYNIAELIEEYEKDYKGSWEHAIEFSKEMRRESEETEVKNKAELKSWFEDDKLYVGEYVKHKIDQLDEPETLSLDWIDENKEMYLINDTSENAVPDYKLQNLLVPKQEELEVKIQELIEAYKQEDGAYSNPENGWISGFIEDLKNLVDEEQKYYVLSKDKKTILLERWASGISPCAMPITEKEEGDMFTEQEIKDYDERYFPFAVKVEELE